MHNFMTPLSATNRPSGVTFSLTHLWRHNPLSGVDRSALLSCPSPHVWRFFSTREEGGGMSAWQARVVQVRRGCREIGLCCAERGGILRLIRTGGCGYARFLSHPLVSVSHLSSISSRIMSTPPSVIVTSSHHPPISLHKSTSGQALPRPTPFLPCFLFPAESSMPSSYRDQCTRSATLALIVAA